MYMYIVYLYKFKYSQIFFIFLLLKPNGTSDGAPIKSIVNKQYNSPVGIYSEQTIAETLSAQAEVLAGGVVG